MAPHLGAVIHSETDLLRGLISTTFVALGVETWEARNLEPPLPCHWVVASGLAEKVIQPCSHVLVQVGLRCETDANTSSRTDYDTEVREWA